MRHSNNGTVVHDGGSVRVGDSPYCPHLSEASLERWRTEGIGPKFLKLPGRVIYRMVEIEAFEESCLATSTKTISSRLTVPV